MPTFARIIRTARRTNAAAGVDLRKRRVWFADMDGGGAGSDSPANGQSGAQNGEIDLSTLPENIRSFIENQKSEWEAHKKKLNDEAASHRIRAKELQEQLEAQRQADAQRLAEQGNYKALHEQTQKQLESVLPYKERTEALENLIRESNKQRIERIPEDYRSLVPADLAPERVASWLDANESKLTKPFAPPTDAGAGGGSGQPTNPKLTAEEKQVAARFGMTEAEYLKYKEANA